MRRSDWSEEPLDPHPPVCVCVCVQGGFHAEFYLSVALTCLSLTTHIHSNTHSQIFSCLEGGKVLCVCVCVSYPAVGFISVTSYGGRVCVCWGEGSYNGFTLISPLMTSLCQFVCARTWVCVCERQMEGNFSFFSPDFNSNHRRRKLCKGVYLPNRTREVKKVSQKLMEKVSVNFLNNVTHPPPLYCANAVTSDLKRGWNVGF